jgi:transcription termination factor Rho
VSDEPQALERSTLQKKDRAELITIATAMGGKPGSRAKKADVIDMILDLAGVEPGDQEVPARPQAPAQAGGATTGPKGTSAGPSGDDADADADADADDQATPDEASPDRAAGAKTRNDRARSDRGPAAGKAQPDTSTAGNKAQSDKGSAARKGQGKAGDDQGLPGGKGAPSDRGQDADENGRDRSGDQGGRDDDHEAEPGNRRRRRRGRDRGPQGGQDEPFQGEPVEVEGYLDLRDEGYGFLRVNGYLPTPDDVYVSVKQTRQFALRKGDRITGASRPATRNEKNPALMRIDQVNGRDPEEARNRPTWEDLTPLFPDERLRLEADGDPYNMTARIVDLLAPIGKGQRGLIVSPPKAGKTSVMKQIVRSIETNNPEVELIVLLVDERPEEVTDMRRWVKNGEVASSTFDRPPEEHTQVAELVLERAKRQAELGTDVVLVLDGITRLARAYNLSAPQSGRVMSGGVDAAALYPPKRFFGAARNIEEGGSLTVLATALVETGSRMDEVIFEEFKGTGNMELRLDRRLADRRIYPAIDVEGSGTRHEELLFTPKALQQVWKLRRVLSGMAGDSGSNAGGIDLLTDRMRSFKTNDAFLDEIAKGSS